MAQECPLVAELGNMAPDCPLVANLALERHLLIDLGRVGGKRWVGPG